MGNRGKEELVELIFKALKNGKEKNIYDIAKTTNLHLKTVTKYLPLLMRIQSKPRILETKTTGSSLYRLDE